MFAFLCESHAISIFHQMQYAIFHKKYKKNHLHNLVNWVFEIYLIYKTPHMLFSFCCQNLKNLGLFLIDSKCKECKKCWTFPLKADLSEKKFRTSPTSWWWGHICYLNGFVQASFMKKVNITSFTLLNWNSYNLCFKCT